MKTRFRTRYHVTPIDSETQFPIGPTMVVDNLVLDSGYLAMGDAIALSNLTIGGSAEPVDPKQTGVRAPIISTSIDRCVRAHRIDQHFELTSTVTYEYLFKDFKFPSNLRNMSLNEIGFDGVTRAVFEEPLVIERRHWVYVVAEVIYEYGGVTKGKIEYQSAGFDLGKKEIVDVRIVPFVYNPTPDNTTGRGWGADGSVISYIWNGKENDYQDQGLAKRYGITINPTLSKVGSFWNFAYQSEPLANNTPFPGVIVRDTVNGGAFRLEFTQNGEPWSIDEDSSVNLNFKFGWKPSI